MLTVAFRAARFASNSKEGPGSGKVSSMLEDDTGPQENPSGRSSTRRVSVDEAARELGLSVDAIRKRVQRDTIPYEKDAAGRVRVILDASEVSQDDVQDASEAEPDQAQLVDILREQVAYLREQLDQERQARTEERRRQDTIIAQLTSRLPELEAAPETRESPAVSSSEEGRSTTTHTAPRRTEHETTPVGETLPSWWRRIFGVPRE